MPARTHSIGRLRLIYSWHSLHALHRRRDYGAAGRETSAEAGRDGSAKKSWTGKKRRHTVCNRSKERRMSLTSAIVSFGQAEKVAAGRCATRALTVHPGRPLCSSSRTRSSLPYPVPRSARHVSEPARHGCWLARQGSRPGRHVSTSSRHVSAAWRHVPRAWGQFMKPGDMHRALGDLASTVRDMSRRRPLCPEQCKTCLPTRQPCLAGSETERKAGKKASSTAEDCPPPQRT